MFPFEIREEEMHTIVELGLDMKKPKECTYPIHSAFRNVKNTLKNKDTNTQNTKKAATTTSNTAEIRPKDIVSISNITQE